MKAWYLIHSKPGQENTAKEQLQRQGFETYLPLTPAFRKRRGRTIRVIAPMFPRYLFIHLSNETDDWGPIRSTIGVSTLVRFGMEPARVPDALIQAIVSREDGQGVVALPKQEYEEGQNVRIATGPFEGYEAVFTSILPKDRVIVLLKIAENYVKINVDQSDIESI
jgi:transcriptional antiterminator RfaH